MNLNAYVNHQFERGFLLKDEDLTKLLDFIKVRATEVIAAEGLRIKVYRSDSLVYECTDLTSLRNEENAVRNKIIGIQILLDHEDLKINLDFDEDDGVAIKIESSDRDRAYLLYSELKEYLNTEVLIFRAASKFGDRYFWMALAIVGTTVAVVSSMLFFYSPPKMADGALKALIENEDVNTKLNHLIHNAVARDGERKFIAWLPLSVALAAIVEPSLRWAQNHLYPRNIFYFGKEKNRYDQILDRRSKWIWGGVVAFIVSVLAGFAVWFATTG
jgi:hypothetical protein